jgi:lipopolysaccharide export system protein LptA
VVSAAASGVSSAIRTLASLTLALLIGGLAGRAAEPTSQQPSPAPPQAPAPIPLQTSAPTTPSPAPAAPAPSGLVTIESDQQQGDNVTGIITATGNVRILYPDRRVVATSRQAQYFTREERIVLTGDVDVVQEDGNRLRAERVVYLVESERVLAQPGEGQQVFSQLQLQTRPTAIPAGPTPAVGPGPTAAPAPAPAPEAR